MTTSGFGFETVEGNYANPFFASFLSPPGFLEVFTQPALFTQPPGGGYSELPITFAAVIVPEPATAALMLAAFAGLAAMGRRVT